MSNRLNFQRRFIQGQMLNIGCANDPVGFPPENTVHIDLDLWRYRYFVQCDAHHLPFRDKAFDVAFLGDITEHAKNPMDIWLEAKRVARRVIITIFEEWRLNGPGQRVETGVKRGDERRRKDGFTSDAEYKRAMFPRQYIKPFDESKLVHNYHINQLTDQEVENMVKAMNMKVIEFRKAPEAMHEGHQWYNWLIALED